MSLLSDLQPPAKVWPCKVRTVIDSLDKADGEILAAAVMNPDWNYQSLETALGLRGIKLGGAIIKRHRLKGCSCWKI
jgi:hypothetical protein